MLNRYIKKYIEWGGSDERRIETYTPEYVHPNIKLESIEYTKNGRKLFNRRLVTTAPISKNTVIICERPLVRGHINAEYIPKLYNKQMYVSINGKKKYLNRTLDITEQEFMNEYSYGQEPEQMLFPAIAFINHSSIANVAFVPTADRINMHYKYVTSTEIINLPSIITTRDIPANTELLINYYQFGDRNRVDKIRERQMLDVILDKKLKKSLLLVKDEIKTFFKDVITDEEKEHLFKLFNKYDKIKTNLLDGDILDFDLIWLLENLYFLPPSIRIPKYTTLQITIPTGDTLPFYEYLDTILRKK